MKNRVGNILKKHSRLEQLALLLVVILILAFSSAHATVPRDETPVPYEQLAFQGNVFDISGWPATRTLSKVYMNGSLICFPNDIGDSWYEPSGQGVNANAHIILKYNGKWIASPWDYMGVNQTCKHAESVGGIPYYGWKPKPGEELYWFITGISRDSSGGVSQERTNVVKYLWGGEAGYPPPVCDGEEPPVIDSFTATPNPVVLGPTGLLGSNKDYNVQISWNLSNADSAELVNENGDTTEYDANNSLRLLIDKPTTFTLYGKNGCTSEADWPSKTLAVNVRPVSVSYLSNLLLYNSASVKTLGFAEISHNPINIRMHGEVNPSSQKVAAVFEYGLTSNYGKEVNAVPYTITGVKTPIYATATNLAKGTVYHYRAKVKGRDRTTFGEDKTFKTDNVPSVVTDGVSYHASVASTVTLKGRVNPNGDTTTVTFQYGIGDYGTTIAGSALGIPAGITSQSSNALVTGLQTKTAYQYRVCAQNTLGNVCSAKGNFSTFAPPDVGTYAIDNSTVTGTGAILKGRVDPNGKDTTVTFEWGESDSYGSSQDLAVSGDGFRDVSTTIGGLASGTTYHFRITGYNQYGDAVPAGVDRVFTTDSAPSVTTLAADVISSTEVTLRADIAPHGAETSVRFQHSGGACTPGVVWFNTINALNPVPYDSIIETVAVLVDGRSPATTYCYRAVAENGIGGFVYGDAVEFTTLSDLAE